ncbi:MFS transporter [Actinomadura sp. 9N215]|uniref:MFS transporter n=1 Tax=Actinomadura sp. 9N215 TaxID=3375150 RepID=UPI00379152E7
MMLTKAPAHADNAASALPRPYLIWLGAAVTSMIGDAAFSVALGWAATAHGGTAAGLVFGCLTAPKIALVLIGGAVADRIGPRLVMLAGDAMMLVTCLSMAVATMLVGTPLWLLVPVALIWGSVSAFYVPAFHSMPRRLVNDGRMPRALALKQSGNHLAALAGAPLGGLILVSGGMAATAAGNVLTYGMVLLVLVLIRVPFTPTERRTGLVREARDGLGLAFRDPPLRTALLVLSAAIGLFVSVSTLLIPLLTRANGQTATVAGVLQGSMSVGFFVVGLTVARRGGADRLGVASATGILVIGCGTVLLAAAPALPVSITAAALIGAGQGLFSTHIATLIYSASPDSHLSRVSATMSLVQFVSAAVSVGVFGRFADGVGAVAATATGGTLIVLVGLCALASRPFRTARGANGEATATDGDRD